MLGYINYTHMMKYFAATENNTCKSYLIVWRQHYIYNLSEKALQKVKTLISTIKTCIKKYWHKTHKNYNNGYH